MIPETQFLKYKNKQQFLSHLRNIFPKDLFILLEQLLEEEQIDICRNLIQVNLNNPEQKDQILPYYDYYLCEKAMPKFQQKKNHYSNVSQEQILLKQIKEQIDDERENQNLEELIFNQKWTQIEILLGEFIGRKNLAKKQYMERLKEYFGYQKNKPDKKAQFLNEINGIRQYHIKLESDQALHQYLQNSEEDKPINVLAIGNTGVGKSTFLNSLTNYLLGVQKDDYFRYVLEKEIQFNNKNQSSTRNICFYNFPESKRCPIKIRLIDMPGLGDTRGIQQDQENIQLLKNKLDSQILELNLIIYVFKSSDTRLQTYAKYVINRIIGMFAKDMKENFLFLFTFADSMQPNIIPTLQEELKQIVGPSKQKNGDKWFIKINNSAMFKKVEVNDMPFYQMGMNCLKQALSRIIESKAVSTHNSKSMIQKRKQIKDLVFNFQCQFKLSLQKQQSIKNTIREVQLKQIDKKANSQFRYKVKEERTQVKETDNFVTTCTLCNYTCHRNCTRQKDSDKDKCCRMDENGYCRACPRRCKYTFHINDRRIRTIKLVEIEKTQKQMEKKFNIASEEKQKKVVILTNLVDEYCLKLVESLQYLQRIKQLEKQLSELQLKKFKYETNIQYIQYLINIQQQEKRQGYLNRIVELKVLMDHEIRLKKSSQGCITDQEKKDIQNLKQTIKAKINVLISDPALKQKIISKVIDHIEKVLKGEVMNSPGK